LPCCVHPSHTVLFFRVDNAIISAIGIFISISARGGSRNFGKGPGKGVKPRTECRKRGVWGLPPENFNFEKLDAISCNLAYVGTLNLREWTMQEWTIYDDG